MKKLYFSLIGFLFLVVANAQIINIPDAGFKAKLLSATSSNEIASAETPDVNGAVTTYTQIDVNEDGEIQVSEAIAIKYLRLHSSNIINLDGINSFTNLQYLRFDSTSLTSFNASSLTNLVFLSCQNNSQLTNLNVNGLTNLKRMFCVTNELTSINMSGLTSIEYFNCSNNNFTSLDVSGLPSLINLFCNDNPITNLNFTGLTNLQYLNCSSTSLSSLNASGLTNLKKLICFNNQISNLIVSGLTNLEELNCQTNQLSSINVSSLTNLKILNTGINQLTNINVNGLTNLNELWCNGNQLSSLSINNLTNLVRLFCEYNQLSSLDISNSSSLNWLNCSDNQLTSINLKNNGPIWSSLYFSSNFNLSYICVDEEDLTFVQTRVDLNNLGSICQVNSYCSFTPGGTLYTVHGINKIDGDNNGCNATDGIYPNLKFSITDGTNSGTLISNASGTYSIPVSAGTHTVTPQFENPSYFTSSPANTIVSFPSAASSFNQNFCIVPNGVHHDLEVVIIPLEVARPGFDATYRIKYRNKGNLTETATLVFNYDDAVLDYISSGLVPTAVTTGLISWNIGTITPFESGGFTITLNVNSPTETPAVNGGDTLNYIATLNGLSTDETPIDNEFALKQIVVNSYDPNDKTCLEGTTINPSMIGQYVHYQIRFENTGTFPAENIVVKDMIDTTKFEISTLQITDASHSCVTRITNPNNVEFIFEDINLPFNDATNDGYVVFKIKTKSTLATGNTISNLANIYFDYNFPIVTNTATSTFQVLGNSEFDLNNSLSLYPIPTKDILNFSLKNNDNITSISIYNMLGQIIQTITNPSNSIDVSSLEAGSYLIKIAGEKVITTGKFLKE